jgi:hypothetical protein
MSKKGNGEGIKLPPGDERQEEKNDTFWNIKRVALGEYLGQRGAKMAV